jgi:hypothetical protein
MGSFAMTRAQAERHVATVDGAASRVTRQPGEPNLQRRAKRFP